MFDTIVNVRTYTVRVQNRLFLDVSRFNVQASDQVYVTRWVARNPTRQVLATPPRNRRNFFRTDYVIKLWAE
jgi:hypothetical protein